MNTCDCSGCKMYRDGVGCQPCGQKPIIRPAPPPIRAQQKIQVVVDALPITWLSCKICHRNSFTIAIKERNNGRYSLVNFECVHCGFVETKETS